MTWTRITDQDEAFTRLPAWFARQLVGRRGRFGVLLTTGDVVRITSIKAVLMAPGEVVLLDVALDLAGVPDGVDLAWQTKHFLGMPFPGAEDATINLAQVVMIVEFSAAVPAVANDDAAVPSADEVVEELNRLTEQPAESISLAEPTARV